MVVDCYSRFFEVVVLKSTTTARIIAALIDIFARFGFPYTLKTANRAQFVSGESEDFYRNAELNIESHNLTGHKRMEKWKDRTGYC